MAGAARDLPWRRRRDPYAVWVSEIMLQQTQVATVTPYFERWLERFPDVGSLAAAPLDDVLKAWEGLGYYARARNLQAAAKAVVARHGGELPADRAALLALPGIGRYTAGAILSLAFGQREPVLDGNVKRVLARVYDIAEDPRTPRTEAELWRLSTALVEAAPPGQAGELNESLMELGALVCTPTAPQCLLCPLNALCLARERGTVEQRPHRTPRPVTPHYDVTAAVVQDTEGRYLLVQRPLDGLLGGLWGFPGGTVRVGEPTPAALERAVREQTGVDIRTQSSLPSIRHAYTHFRITLHPFTAAYAGGTATPLTCAAVAWVRQEELGTLPFAITDRKIVAQLSSS